MPLQMDSDRLSRLLEDFYLLTGVGTVVLDEKERVLFSYPQGGISFCREMRKNPNFLRGCEECHRWARLRCRREGKMTEYRCHSGLMEAVCPLYEDGRIVGFLTFGPMGSGCTRAKLTAELSSVCQSFGCSPPADIKSVPIRTSQQILASANILETCVESLCRYASAAFRRDELMRQMEAYIREHLEDDLSVQVLCREFSVSRSALYRLFPEEGGIASFVRSLRMEESLRLLKNTDLSVGEIAHRVGFRDESYFRRLFRKYFAMGVRQARKSAQ